MTVLRTRSNVPLACRNKSNRYELPQFYLRIGVVVPGERDASARASSEPMWSAIYPSNSGKRWPYRSRVMLIVEWPMRRWIALGWAPWLMARATAV